MLQRRLFLQIWTGRGRRFKKYGEGMASEERGGEE